MNKALFQIMISLYCFISYNVFAIMGNFNLDLNALTSEILRKSISLMFLHVCSSLIYYKRFYYLIL